MTRVAIVGIGITKFGKHDPLVTAQDLLAESSLKAINDAGIELKDIDAIYTGNFSSDIFEKQTHFAQMIPSQLGLIGKPSTRIENACASGGVALYTAYMSIKSGMYDVVLVGGAEKMTNLPTSSITDALARASDYKYEARYGITFPGVFAMMARAHMHAYGTKREHLAAVAVKAHDNALNNPIAQFHKKITIEKALNSIMVADPLTLYDCSPITDGAASLVLVNLDKFKDFEGEPVEIIGVGQASDAGTMFNREDFTSFKGTKIAARRAYKMAGVEPKDIDVVEVHDCFTIAEIIASEDLGFFPKGQGGFAAYEGRTRIDGDRPINTSGGLKAKGHPIGATGIAQAYEIVTQLRDKAGKRQVPDAEIGLTQNLGGSGASIAVHIFRRI